MPPLPPYLLHAAALVTGATGALNATQKGFSASVRNGAGDYTLTYGEQIDGASEGFPVIVPRGAATRMGRAAVLTDTTVQVVCDIGGAAADTDFAIFVLRYNWG